MSCPYLKEVVMLYCQAYPVKKLIPLDRIASADPCLGVDFEAGDLVSMTGAAEIVWDGPQVEAIAGAQRLVRFRAEQVVRLPGRLPLAFAFGEYSPIFERLEQRR